MSMGADDAPFFVPIHFREVKEFKEFKEFKGLKGVREVITPCGR